MSDNRIRVRVNPEMTPVRLEDRMDLNSQIDVQVDSHLTGLGAAGLVCVLLGMASIVVGAVMFLQGYPTRWQSSFTFVETILLVIGGGIITFFFGMSAFFYGRTVLGSGQLDEYQLQGNVEGTGGDASGRSAPADRTWKEPNQEAF